MILKSEDRLALGLLLGTASVTALLYAKLPPLVPTHFDLSGAPDGWMPRAIGAWLLPAVALAAWLLVRFGAPAAKLGAHAVGLGVFGKVALVVTGLLAGLQSVVLYAALSGRPSVGVALGLLLGASFVVIGLLMPRVRRNPFVGVRTAWALASDENWSRAQREGGYAFVAGGLVAFFASLVGAASFALVAIVLAALVPIALSLAHAWTGR